MEISVHFTSHLLVGFPVLAKVTLIVIFLGPATPNTPYGAHWSPNPSADTRKHYKKVIQGIISNRQELSQQDIYKMERFRNQKPQDSESFKLKAAKDVEMKEMLDQFPDQDTLKARHENNLEARGIPLVGRDKRSFDELMEEKYKKQGKSWKNCGEEISKKARLELDRSARCEEEQEGSAQVLAGVVLLVAKKLSAQSSELHRVVKSLGGAVAMTLSPSVTHFVFQGRPKDLNKEFRQAKQQNCKIVSPDWVYFCRDENDRVEESTFPHTFNPRMKLDLSVDSSSMSISKMSKQRLIKPKTNLGEKIEEVQEGLDDTVAAEAPASAEDDMEDLEVKEMTTELAGLTSLLGNQTPVRTNCWNNSKISLIFDPDCRQERRRRIWEQKEDLQSPHHEGQLQGVDPD